MAKKIDTEMLLSLYRTMLLIRTTENCLAQLFADGEVPGFVHLSIGQEGVPAGVMSALDHRDTMASNHRGHGHVVARGIDLALFFKEIMGKAGGICGGRGGSMHVADLDLGILGANGIVGAGIPIALGSALAHSVRKTDGVAVVFFGDGAMAEGVFHESLNLAALWKLPLFFVCENNGWAEFTPTSKQFVGELGALAQAFKVPYVQVDGNDVEAVATTARRCVAAIREGGGPSVLECKTHRVSGHFAGDAQKYRAPEDIKEALAADPIKRIEEVLRSQKVTEEILDAVRTSLEAQVVEAIEEARADGPADFARALEDVYTSATPN